MASLSFKLSADERQTIRDAVAGLTGKARQHESARLRSQLLRLNPDYRAADNAKKAEREREKYHANPNEARRKSLEKWRRRSRAS